MEIPSEQKKIILVEDDPDISWLVQLQLEQVGYMVHAASDGDEGLREYWACGADLMLLDIDLPGLSGWEVYERVREVSTMPIVMLTAYPHLQDNRPSSFGKGADGYVGKPFSFGELLAQIKLLLRESPAPDAAPRRAWDGEFPTKLSPKRYEA